MKSKQSTKVISVVLSIFIMSSLCFGQAAQITIPEGTKIRVRLEHDLSSKTVEEGHSIQLSVMDPIRIGETVVIAQGASVTGRVSFAQEKRRLGRAGKIELSIDSVVAVDNERIPLRTITYKKEGKGSGVLVWTMFGIGTGVGCFLLWPLLGLDFFLLKKGQDVKISTGTAFEVFTDRAHVLLPSR